MAKWLEKTLGEVTAFIAKGIPPKYTEEENENTIRVLNQKCNRNFEISYSESRIHDCGKKKVPEDKMLRAGDVLINSTGTGTAGRVAQMIEVTVPTTIDGHMILIRPSEELDPIYYGYAVKSFESQIEGLAEGSTGQTEINRRRLQDEVIIRYPSDKLVQRNIGSFLANIDEKIKTNTEINKNLEQQIEMVLLKTINDTDTQPVKLGDYLYIKGRIGWKGLKKSEYLPISNYRIINGESLTLSGIDWNKAGYISAERYEESPEIMLSIGDILLSKDGTIGKIGYVDKLDAPTSVASGIFVIRNTRQSEISTQFIYYLLKSKLFKAFIASRTEGSVIPHLYQKDFMEFEFQLPSPDDMKIFDDTTADMFSLVFSNLNENERLIHLRDSLLPKLMSGELDVSDTDI